MVPRDLLLYTRALMVSPEAFVKPAPRAETFQWVKQPRDQGEPLIGKFYVDGSMLDADWKLAGCCARRGWAFAVVDHEGNILASAHGRPPGWTGGIHGAELWSLLMASSHAMPQSVFRVDCMAVQLGSQHGMAWASAPERHLARAWAPLAAALEDRVNAVVWMPAHCTDKAVGTQQLSDGSFLTRSDVRANAIVDELAKAAAAHDRLPLSKTQWVRNQWDRVTTIATWIGQATVLAEAFPAPPDVGNGGNRRSLRDNEGRQHMRPAAMRVGQRKRHEVACQPPLPCRRAAGDLTGCERWEALRRRIVAKQARDAEPG